MKIYHTNWLLGNNNSSLLVKIMRWIARIWGLAAFTIALLIAISPDPYATEPVPLKDWFILSLWGIAILGLIIAWRWERLGAWITIVTMAVRELLYVILNHEWGIYFLLVWALVIPPAILYLIASYMDTKKSS